MIKCILCLLLPVAALSQVQWKNVDSLFQPLPKSVHVYFTNDSLDGKPNLAYYLQADLKDKSLSFTADTGSGRRLTPSAFFEKNHLPLLIVNCTFFEFVHNSNLEMVINNGKLLAYNASVAGRGKDTFTYQHVFASAIGVSKKRKADVAYTYTDSSQKYAYAVQSAYPAIKDSSQVFAFNKAVKLTSGKMNTAGEKLRRWKMKTAVGGGPVLVQNAEVKITNNEELKFSGKAIEDKHPRTGMGYTADNKLIIMVIQGRFPGKAEGATLTQEARLFKDLGCSEALNLDGGGSSCMLVNGKETIKPSDKEGQRPIPAVFIISRK